VDEGGLDNYINGKSDSWD